MGCDVPKLILVQNLSPFPSLPALLCWEKGWGMRTQTHAHTLEACSSTNKVTKLVRTNEEVRACTGLSYKQTITIPFRWNASVPRSRSGNPASGWIKTASKLGLRWGAEARFQTPPWKAFQKHTLCFIYKNLQVSLPGPSD